MTKYLVFVIIIAALVLFIWGRWRYDVVAMLALMAVVAVGAVPFSYAFNGFSNPAVVTVAAVMIISRAITDSGIVDDCVRYIAPMAEGNIITHIAILTVIAAILSAFMNNVGALGLIMPVAIQSAIKTNRSPSILLMPIAFGSILGGMTTLIGTPPNILISTFRHDYLGQGFGMFSFMPVGGIVASVGVLYLILIGWRLLPQPKKNKTKSIDQLFQIEDYFTEVKVNPDSSIIDNTIAEIEEQASVVIYALIRNNRKKVNPGENEKVRIDDILVIEASPTELDKLVSSAKLQLVGSKALSPEVLSHENLAVMEAVVMPGSRVEGRTPQRLKLRTRYGLNLLAIARKGQEIHQRLKNVRLSVGDVLLMQGEEATLRDSIAEIGFLPIAKRGLSIGTPKRKYLSIIIFLVALIATTCGLLPIQISFAGAVLAMILFNVITIRGAYESIDLSIIVLLGAMIPVGGAMELTGGAQLLGATIVQYVGNMPVAVIIGAIMLVTIALTDVMNNAATAVLMAPIAANIATALNFNVDPFLMTVVVGASSSFMTPIGHQNNTIVMGPGGYKFGDYWRMGLPLDVIVVLVAIPCILHFWPV